MSETKKPVALIVGHKLVASTPRILKEIDWLMTDGWQVDTLGLGSVSPTNGQHIQIGSSSSIARYLTYFVRIKKLRFWLLYGRYLPRNLSQILESYDLVIIHEPTFFPSSDFQEFILKRKGRGIHIDLHEDHLSTLSRNALEKFAFEAYRAWELGSLTCAITKTGSDATVSTVSSVLRAKYESVFGRPVAVVRNAPASLNIGPSGVDPCAIQLVHHGVGTTHRGIEQSIIAMRGLPSVYRLNFHLVSGPTYLIKVRLLAFLLGVYGRVRFHDPVPTPEIPRALNAYDLALVVIPPITENEREALPNKFFESIQARLAIITGPNPTMAHIVNDLNIGVVTNAWKSKDIVEGVLTLSVGEIERLKANVHSVSSRFSSDSDQATFQKTISRHLRS
jgi:glycosyltransferase involved in cell wall biosynthesis